MPATAPRFSFRPRWWALALAVSGCAAGIALGNWQSGRAEQKRAAAASLRTVEMRGRFDARHMVFLDNKLHKGRPGYEVVQPLVLDKGAALLVNRGWVPAGATRESLPQVPTPVSDVAVSGVRLERFRQAYALGASSHAPGVSGPEGWVWQNVTVEQFAAWSGLRLEPWVLEQHSALDDGLVRDWPRPDAGIEKHESYALQWYSLAALSLILFLSLSLKFDKPRS